MTEEKFNKDEVIGILNKILELELAGVVRYTHYSFMVFGYNRIPIVSWLRDQATEALTHAQQAGEMITGLGGHPSLAIGKTLETENHDIGAILKESLEAETEALQAYKELLKAVENKSIYLEEYARQMVHAEETHAQEVNKMLRTPGKIEVFEA